MSGTNQHQQTPKSELHDATRKVVSILRDIVERFDGPGLADDQEDALAAAHKWLCEHDPDPTCCTKCASGVRKLAWMREWICDNCGLVFLPNKDSQPVKTQTNGK